MKKWPGCGCHFSLSLSLFLFLFFRQCFTKLLDYWQDWRQADVYFVLCFELGTNRNSFWQLRAAEPPKLQMIEKQRHARIQHSWSNTTALINWVHKEGQKLKMHFVCYLTKWNMGPLRNHQIALFWTETNSWTSWGWASWSCSLAGTCFLQLFSCHLALLYYSSNTSTPLSVLDTAAVHLTVLELRCNLFLLSACLNVSGLMVSKQVFKYDGGGSRCYWVPHTAFLLVAFLLPSLFSTFAQIPVEIWHRANNLFFCLFVLFCSVLFFKRCCYISFIRENFLDQDQSLQFIVEETVKVLKINDKPVPPSGFLSDGRGCSEQLLPCDKKQLTRHQLM